MTDSTRSAYFRRQWEMANRMARLRRRLKLGPARAPIDPAIADCREVTAVIFACGPAPMLDQVRASLQAQTLPPARVEIVRDVTPVSLAFQQGLELVDTTFYASVDEDMILHPRCFEQLYYLINQDPNRAEVVLGLDDPLLGVIQGIHFYRTAVVKGLRFHPLDPARDKGPERHMATQIREAGYHTHANVSIVAGIHHPVYEPVEAFWKFKLMGEKVRYYPVERWNYDGRSPLFWHIDQLADYWKKTGDLVAVYALAGLFDGLMNSEDIAQCGNYENRDRHPAFKRVEKFLSGFDNIPRVPFHRRLVRGGWRRIKSALSKAAGLARP